MKLFLWFCLSTLLSGRLIPGLYMWCPLNGSSGSEQTLVIILPQGPGSLGPPGPQHFSFLLSIAGNLRPLRKVYIFWYRKEFYTNAEYHLFPISLFSGSLFPCQ